MSKVHSIRRMRMEGYPIAQISKTLGVSRGTVYKYLAESDLSSKPPVHKPGRSVMDQYRPLIVSWLEENRRSWHKQREFAPLSLTYRFPDIVSGERNG
jgi:transposase